MRVMASSTAATNRSAIPIDAFCNNEWQPRTLPKPRNETDTSFGRYTARPNQRFIAGNRFDFAFNDFIQPAGGFRGP
jgi:hypothetical protein